MQPMRQKRTPSLNQPEVPKKTEGRKVRVRKCQQQKEMRIVEHSQEHALKANKEVERNRSEDTIRAPVGIPTKVNIDSGGSADFN